MVLGAGVVAELSRGNYLTTTYHLEVHGLRDVMFWTKEITHSMRYTIVV